MALEPEDLDFALDAGFGVMEAVMDQGLPVVRSEDETAHAESPTDAVFKSLHVRSLCPNASNYNLCQFQPSRVYLALRARRARGVRRARIRAGSRGPNRPNGPIRAAIAPSHNLGAGHAPRAPGGIGLSPGPGLSVILLARADWAGLAPGATPQYVDGAEVEHMSAFVPQRLPDPELPAGDVDAGQQPPLAQAACGACRAAARAGRPDLRANSGFLGEGRLGVQVGVLSVDPADAPALRAPSRRT